MRWSFQTTYEELKQRNELEDGSLEIISLSDYLWGIETNR